MRDKYDEVTPEGKVISKEPPLPRLPLPLVIACIVYVLTVLVCDLLGLMGSRLGADPRWFQWSPLDLHRFLLSMNWDVLAFSWLRYPAVQAFDLFKFTWWFLVPFLISLPWLDRQYLGFRAWNKWDLAVFLSLSVCAVGAVALVGYVPGLREYYPGMGSDPWHVRIEFLQRNLFWLASWLIGWEFMFRYFLLRAVGGYWPAYGWLLLPLLEGLYHLPKHPLEIVGMVALSFVMTLYTLKRRNWLLAFLVHLEIELLLVAYLFFF